jgi:hypothetical protein
MDFNPIINALTDHFAINKKEIMLPTPMDYDDEFMVMDKPVEVVTRQVAWDNIVENYGVDVAVKYSTINSIDYYRRLADTDYFFRWL